tara:strand:- start:1554 stop:1901 length:348 start_codon:yes stop_codon:yes gene_type:complete
MQKYIKVTGLTNTVQVVNCNNILGIVRPNTTSASFGITTADTETKIVYIDANSATSEVTTFDHAAAGSGTNRVAQANFIKDLIVQAWEQPYTEPFVTVDGTDFPLTVTLVNPAGS